MQPFLSLLSKNANVIAVTEWRTKFPGSSFLTQRENQETNRNNHTRKTQAIEMFGPFTNIHGQRAARNPLTDYDKQYIMKWLHLLNMLTRQIGIFAIILKTWKQNPYILPGLLQNEANEPQK